MEERKKEQEPHRPTTQPLVPLENDDTISHVQHLRGGPPILHVPMSAPTRSHVSLRALAAHYPLAPALSEIFRRPQVT